MRSTKIQSSFFLAGVFVLSWLTSVPCLAAWQLSGPAITSHFVLQPTVFNAEMIIGADDAIHVQIGGEWTEIPLSDMTVFHGIETPEGDILVLAEDDVGSGGIYLLNPDPMELRLLEPVDNPLFISYSQATRRTFVGTLNGLRVSLDGRHWFPVEHFNGFPVHALCDRSETTLSLLAQDSDGFHQADLSSDFGSVIDNGLLDHEPISEASGLAASSANTGVFWTHNDSGGAASFFAFSQDGTHLGIYTLDGITNRDWEDMALATVHGTSYLYAGDIGDNSRVHDTKFIYRVQEPDVDSQQTPGEWTLPGGETLAFQYPDNEKYDCETLMVDPATGDIYVVTKRNLNNSATDDDDDLVFRIPWQPDGSWCSLDMNDYLVENSFATSHRDPIIAEYITVLDIPVAVSWGAGYGATAGDIDPSATDIIVKTYTGIYLLQREPGQSLTEAFMNDWIELPYTVEPQGEAVCWAPDAMTYFTTSEEPYSFLQAHLYQFPRYVWDSMTVSSPRFQSLTALPGDGILGVCAEGHNGDGVYISVDQGLTWTARLRSRGISAFAVDDQGQALMGWDNFVSMGDGVGVGWLDIGTGDLVWDNVGLGNLDVTGASIVDGGDILVSTRKGVYSWIGNAFDMELSW